MPEGAEASCRSGRTILYRARDLVHHAHVVGADLVSESTRTRVDEHGDLPFEQAENGRSTLVEDRVHHLHFEEVIAAAERAELVPSGSMRAL